MQTLLSLHNWVLVPNDVSMSIGHLDHVLSDCVQLNGACDLEITWSHQCVAELVGSCIPIHAYRGLLDPNCLFHPSGLSLCLSVNHFYLVPVDDMVLFHGMVCDGGLVSYTALPGSRGSGLHTSCERVHFFFCAPWSSDQIYSLMEIVNTKSKQRILLGCPRR